MLEHQDEALDGRRDVALPPGEGGEQLLGLGNGATETILKTMTPGVALGLDQLSDVGGILDRLLLVPASRVLGEQLVTLEDADPFDVGEDRHGAAHVLVGHRVFVGVETHIGRASHPGLDDLVGRKRLVGHGQEQRPLLVVGLLDGAPTIPRPPSVIGEIHRPLDGGLVEVFERPVVAQGEKGGPQITDGTLDAPLLVAAPRCHGPGLESVVVRQLQEAGMEEDRVAPPFEHDAFEVVVEPDSGDAGEEPRRPDVAVEEAGETGVVVENGRRGAANS